MNKPRRPKYIACIAVGFLLAVAIAGPAIAGNFHNGGTPTVQLSNVNPNGAANPGTNVSYTFTLRPSTTASTIRRFEYQLQTSGGVNGVPAGMSLAGTSPMTTTGLGGLSYGYDSANSNQAAGLFKYTNSTGSAPAATITTRVSGITNPTAAGKFYVLVSSYDATTAGTLIDQDTVTVTITNGTVALSTSIGQTLTFSLSASSLALAPALSPSALSTAAHTMSISTNAVNGYAVRVSGSTLTAGVLSIPFISSGGTVTIGTSNFGLRVTSCPGGATCPYTTTDTGAAAQTSIVSRNSGITGDTPTVTYRAAVSGTQAAAAYSAAINYVASGQF